MENFNNLFGKRIYEVISLKIKATGYYQFYTEILKIKFDKLCIFYLDC